MNARSSTYMSIDRIAVVKVDKVINCYENVVCTRCVELMASCYLLSCTCVVCWPLQHPVLPYSTDKLPQVNSGSQLPGAPRGCQQC